MAVFLDMNTRGAETVSLCLSQERLGGLCIEFLYAERTGHSWVGGRRSVCLHLGAVCYQFLFGKECFPDVSLRLVAQWE